MENTIQPPPSSPTPTSYKGMKFMAVLILLAAVVALVLAFQQGSYLRTQIFSGQSDEQVATEQEQSEELTADQYTKLDAFCSARKEFFIQNVCGNAPPEGDYHCRTADAETEFQACMDTVTIEKVELYEQAIQQDTVEEDNQEGSGL